jgi:hypothetical protein
MQISETTKALLELSKAGRVVLAYILEKFDPEGELIELDKPDIIQWMKEKYSSTYANTVNVNRGIRDLIDKQVLDPYTDTDPVNKIGKTRYFVHI